ncbi:MAG: tetratricopeptide repeat protein [Hyphomicrobium sp.]|uniref:tetratricopeptide repeat protein n=1 Tax=Hyphomicrobium sp. TaxID=82 RepID=UPI001327C9F6|nr:tetratricopeptide repeat protein [Hyphomicrobium sp.]KAB2943527.1 MAG: tetratricopeptide repeat protein [Hyphomicrobium sp.]MBZ0209762.1 tetratricopeptide repeat protein [Hyphomicrobium sp.]
MSERIATAIVMFGITIAVARAADVASHRPIRPEYRIVETVSLAPPMNIELTDASPSLSLRKRMLSRRAYDLGVEYTRRGDLARAFEQLTTAIRFDPDNAIAYAARANVRSLRGDSMGAIGDADYAVARSPRPWPLPITIAA